MSLDEFDAFLAADPAPKGPSNLRLDQLAAGELDGEAARAVEAEVAGDVDLANDLKRRRLGTAAITDVDTGALLARIKAELGPPAPAPRESPWRRLLRAPWFIPGLVAAGAAAAVVVLAVRPADPGGALPGLDAGLRAKGALRLQVIRQTPTGSERMISGATFRPGDTLRFRVDAPGAGALRVLGVEADGTLYTAWPAPGQAGGDVAGPEADRLLDGSVELDDTTGREVLHLVHCPPGVEPTCTSAGPEAAPHCPAGCVSSPFALEKRAD